MNTVLKTVISPEYRRGLKRSYYILRSALYYGEGLSCPACGRSFRKMVDGGRNQSVVEKYDVIGAGFIKNKYCPFCNSNCRDRLLILYLRNVLCVFDHSFRLSVLHIAPEKSLLKLFMDASFGLYVPCDLLSDHVQRKVDVCAMEFEDETFDIVICNHVLEHVQQDCAAISEIYRVLKRDGSAILQVPYSTKINKTLEHPDSRCWTNEQRQKEYGQFDHLRLYAKDNYLERLTRAGFDVREYKWWESFPTWAEYALNSREIVFHGRKLVC